MLAWEEELLCIEKKKKVSVGADTSRFSCVADKGIGTQSMKLENSKNKGKKR